MQSALFRSLSLGLALGAAAAFAAHAAPSELANPDAPPLAGSTATNPGSRGILDDAAAAEVPNTSRTIKMLLEMQKANPTLESGDVLRSGAASAPRIAARAKPAKIEQAFASASSPFGSDAELAPGAGPAAAKASAVDWTGAVPGAVGGSLFESGGATRRPDLGPPSGIARSARADVDLPRVDLRGFLPTALIRYLRENRSTVLALSAIALVLMAAGASFFSKKR